MMVLTHDKNLTVTVQSDGSVTFVQESNDIRDTQQIVHLSAKEWQLIKGVEQLLLSK